jgi:hypothetical protein
LGFVTDNNATWTHLFPARPLRSKKPYAGNWQRQIQIELAGDGPESRSVIVYRGRSQLTIPLGSSSKEEETRTTPIVFDWKDFEGKHHVRTPKIGSRGLEIEGSDEDLLDFFYFAASQTIGSSENAGRFSEMRRAGRGPAFVKLLTKEYKWIRDLAIEVVAGSPIIYAKTHNSDEMLPLAYISGGINRMISVMLAIASRERSIVLADGIENGVFHTHHVGLWRSILDLIKNYKGQIFATTHSYEWLEALVKAAGDKLDDIALWRLERGDNGEPVLFQFEGETLKGAIKHGAESRGG